MVNCLPPVELPALPVGLPALTNKGIAFLLHVVELQEISANYGGTVCPCKWFTDYGGPEQRGKCKSYGPNMKGSSHWNSFVGIGGKCGPEGDMTNNINLKNITYRRLKGTVKTPGGIDCRKGNPCTIVFEDVELKSALPWECGNAHITTIGTVTPKVPVCPVGPGP